MGFRLGTMSRPAQVRKELQKKRGANIKVKTHQMVHRILILTKLRHLTKPKQIPNAF